MLAGINMFWALLRLILARQILQLARKMRHNARQSDNNICFYFDALFLFTRETISDCLSRYPAWSFLVWFKRRTTITDGVSTLYA